MSLSEEVIVLNDGKIKQQSPPHDTYTKPQNVFVAQFIGSPNINIFSGYLNEECLVIEELGQEIELPDGVTDEIRLAVPSGDVYVGIRPPSFETTNRDNAFSSEVKLKEHMGENVVLHLRLPENGREIRAVIPSQINPDIGESIKLGFDLSDPHIFDANSGEAITSGVQKPPSSPTR